MKNNKEKLNEATQLLIQAKKILESTGCCGWIEDSIQDIEKALENIQREQRRD